LAAIGRKFGQIHRSKGATGMSQSPSGVVEISNPKPELICFGLEEPHVFHTAELECMVVTVCDSVIEIPSSATPLLRHILLPLEEFCGDFALLMAKYRRFEILLDSRHHRLEIIKRGRKACAEGGMSPRILSRANLGLVA
jgi:hypothetical protein